MSIKTKKVIKIIVVLLLLSISLILYSRYLATSGLKVKEYKVVNDKITDGLYGLKIVHISDIHYGRIVDLNKLETIVEKINLINPDIVVLTGDLFDRG